MEFAFILPILGIVLLGLLEFTVLFYARGSVVEASRVGARTATLAGAQWEDVSQAVTQTLSPSLRSRARIDFQPGGQSGDVVAVAVSVPMRAASPDFLWPVGFSLVGRQLHAETRMIKE